MRNDTCFLFIFSVVAAIFLCSCSNTKYIPDGDALYLGAKLKVSDSTKKNIKDESLEAAQKTIFPQPNRQVFGMRLRLFAYSHTREPDKKKGLRYAIKYKFGEPPVLLSTVKPEAISKVIANRFNNYGHFGTAVNFKLNEKDKKASITYVADVPSAYKISEIKYPDSTNRMGRLINQTRPQSALKAGDFYNLDHLKAEQTGIDAHLKDSGYYYFSPSFILFKVDTSKGDRTCSISITLKKDLPPEAAQVYHISNVVVNTEYDIRSDSARLQVDTTFTDDVYFISKTDKFRPKIILGSVFYRPGDLYSARVHDLTMKRLIGLGAFRYGSIKYDSSGIGLFDAHVNLTPSPKYTFRGEFQLTNKSSGFIGPGLNLTLRNYNVFHGAELLSLNFNISYEQQFFNRTNYSDFGIGLKPQLSIPRFLVPFFGKKLNSSRSSLFVPKTIFSLGYELTINTQFFHLNSFTFNYGYSWKPRVTTQHDLYPVQFSYIITTQRTVAFDSILKIYPTLVESFSKQFIPAISYTFTYDDHPLIQRRNHWYFRGNVELAGNLFRLLQNTFSTKPAPDTGYEIFGNTFSQYALGETDGRYYISTGKQSQLVARLFMGIGVPYGNSSTLPYIKSFFAGGVSSIRGFYLNGLGPGSYNNPNLAPEDQIFERYGDMKLESNLEFRFPVYRILKGAVFADAGNIWKLDTAVTGEAGVFRFNKFYKEIALTPGIGLRLDIAVFVIRLDVATPFINPLMPEGQRWVVPNIDFGSPTWRSQNLVFNLAFGYPF